MRSIKIVIVIIIGPLFAGLVLAGLVHAIPEEKTLSSASSDPMVDSSHQIEAAGYDFPALPGIRPSLRISIPYGFAPTLPLRSNGQEVLVSGHGSCTDGETFTVAVTVTHTASGAVARGNLAETCTGEAMLQEWQLTAVAESDNLSVGPAETCGFVQTFDGEFVTDKQAWCVDVKLGNYLFLPIIAH